MADPAKESSTGVTQADPVDSAKEDAVTNSPKVDSAADPAKESSVAAGPLASPVIPGRIGSSLTVEEATTLNQLLGKALPFMVRCNDTAIWAFSSLTGVLTYDLVDLLNFNGRNKRITAAYTFDNEGKNSPRRVYLIGVSWGKDEAHWFTYYHGQIFQSWSGSGPLVKKDHTSIQYNNGYPFKITLVEKAELQDMEEFISLSGPRRIELVTKYCLPEGFVGDLHGLHTHFYATGVFSDN
jgi:hypothetical protein